MLSDLPDRHVRQEHSGIETPVCGQESISHT
jgi:hypothetical protein